MRVRPYPDREKALHQVQRNRYYHAHGPTAPKLLVPLGVAMAEIAAAAGRFSQQMAVMVGLPRPELCCVRCSRPASGCRCAEGPRSGTLIASSPVDPVRCVACGQWDENCRCTWNSR